MRRGEIYWAHFDDPIGRRPALVLTRTSALGYLTSVTVAQVTTKVRNTRAEVGLGRTEGLSQPSVANLFNIDTLARTRFDPEPIGALPSWRIPDLDEALCFALSIEP